MPDLVILDSQIENMGGFAVTKAIRQEQGSGSLADCKILILLDRKVDEYIASQSGADSWFDKPLEPVRLLTAVEDLLSE